MVVDHQNVEEFNTGGVNRCQDIQGPYVGYAVEKV